MGQRFFMQYKNKLKEGGLVEVDLTFFEQTCSNY